MSESGNLMVYRKLDSATFKMIYQTFSAVFSILRKDLKDYTRETKVKGIFPKK